MKNSKEQSSSYLTEEFLPYLDTLENDNIKFYINERIIKQIIWYDKKSIYFQQQFKRFTLLSLILSASIPIFMLLDNSGNLVFKILTTVFSASITVITGYLSLSKSKDLWLEYRHSCETLKSTLHKYFTHSDSFSLESGKGKDELLISLCEEVITHEVQDWIKLQVKKDEFQSTSS